MITAKRFYANTLPVPQSYVVYLSSTEFMDQRRLAHRGHPNRCEGVVDILIHLRHLLATSEGIMSKSSMGRAPPFIQLSISIYVYTYTLLK